MTENRRNYYRVLHVQPESPPELIKASYRTLMGTLRMHPDLGGDHTTAKLINEAYAVLSEPARRIAYDLTLRPGYQRLQRVDTARPGAGAPKAQRPSANAAHWASLRRCPLCVTPLPAQILRDTRCARCASPLAAAPDSPGAGRELLGRRLTSRRDRNQAATLHAGWPSPGLPVRWRNISLTGLSVEASESIAAGRAIRISDETLDVVALVVSSRASGRAHTIHARLLTAMFLRSSGVFVSQTA